MTAKVHKFDFALFEKYNFEKKTVKSFFEVL
jgi:hypothetical protein